MYSIYKNETPQGNWRFLSDSDIIKKDDLIRSINYNSGYYSDNVDDCAINKMNWIKCQLTIPAWIGNSVQEFCNSLKEFGNYEFIRKIK